MSLIEQKSLLAKLMATENITIQQAKVDTASFDVKNRVLTLPILKQQLSTFLFDLFMGHEVGHAIWTPLSGLTKASTDGVNMSVLNVVEDSRIERKIKYKYPGLKAPFVKAYKELFDEDFFGTQGKDITKYNFIDRINLHCKIGASLALPFTDEEREILKSVESTETFDEVVEVTKRICEYMKSQPEDSEQMRIKIMVEDENGDSETEKSDNTQSGMTEDRGEESEGQSKGEKEEDKLEEKSKSASNDEGESAGEGEKAKKQDTSAGPGAGRNVDNDKEIRSYTDDAFKANENRLFSDDNTKYVYANVPQLDVSKIMDYKVVYKKYKSEGFQVPVEDFVKYRRESNKVVSYLVKEFELRKNADQMKRASTAKTGDLNMNRLYSYNFTDDIFKKITVMPQGQSHGLVMFLDWSGSMSKHIANTIKQLLNLVMFCKKVNIPFEVYSFVETTDREYMIYASGKPGDVVTTSFGLINLLSSRMTAREFAEAGAAMLEISGANKGFKVYVHTPQFMRMNGTPLNEAIIAAMDIVPAFQKKNRLQIVNTVFLTDGEGSPLYDYYTTDYIEKSKYTHMVIRDPKTRHEEIFNKGKRDSFMSVAMHQTDCYIRLLKARTKSNVIGFFVGDRNDIVSRMAHFYPEYKTYREEKNYKKQFEFETKIKNDFRQNNFVIVDSTGFDDYYILRSSGLDTDDAEELTFKGNVTTRGMVSAFSKYASNKINSRVILNRFIGLIS